MQETLNQIRQLHDKVDELIDELEGKSEERSSFQSSFQSLAQTQTFAMSATIIRA
jgi:nitrate/nitrite-specific signal transduction histidine kinase